MPKKPGSSIVYLIIVISVFVLLGLGFMLNSKPSDTSAPLGTDNFVYRKLQMGTLVEITVMDGDPEAFDTATGKAYRKISELEKLFSSYTPLSDVSQISLGAGRGPIPADPRVVTVALKAKQVSVLSGGAFDPTIGSLAGLWGFSGEKGYVPTAEELAEALPRVDFNKIVIDKEASTIELTERRVAFNLGGIAKGYIIGEAVKVLQARGVTRAIIKAGGDMFAFNITGKETRPFKIGIRDPRGTETELIGEVYLGGGAVATSGDYERFFMHGGVRYHHILDPKTGLPAMKTRSATVVTQDPTLADALSTSVFVLGPVKGMELIESMDGVEGVVVGPDGKITTSSGFEGKIF
ncbi:MAG: FAD:protein FMN transferase [Proteobacteria bacterium]|nr:FAD:protein FMN transferase [Pseudomonadota bacterium]